MKKFEKSCNYQSVIQIRREKILLERWGPYICLMLGCYKPSIYKKKRKKKERRKRKKKPHNICEVQAKYSKMKYAYIEQKCDDFMCSDNQLNSISECVCY